MTISEQAFIQKIWKVANTVITKVCNVSISYILLLRKVTHYIKLL